MKRYIYMLFCLGVLLSMSACEIIAELVKRDYHFGDISVMPAARSAIVTSDIPYLTIDGVRQEGGTFSIGYCRLDMPDDMFYVDKYDLAGNKAIFMIVGLEPETTYLVYNIFEHDQYGWHSRLATSFTTEKEEIHIPTYEVTCNASIDASGIFVKMTLTNVDYLVDGGHKKMDKVTVEYAKKSSNITKWEVIEIDGGRFIDNSETFRIPKDNNAYLEENTDYVYRVTVTPKDSALDPLTTEQRSFKTAYAKITANITTPTVTIAQSNINVESKSVKVLIDGVELDSYPCKYSILYRKEGANSWGQQFEAKKTNSGIKLSIPLDNFTKGETYEFAAAVSAGAKETMVLSNTTSLTVPHNDTTTIDGTWHLTEWRGTAPSFEVYLDITGNGIVDLWQKIESRTWELFTSTVNYKDNIISGTYSDGVAWGTSYYVSVNGDKMTWTDVSDATDVSVYERATLPSDIDTTTTRSTKSEGKRFL